MHFWFCILLIQGWWNCCWQHRMDQKLNYLLFFGSCLQGVWFINWHNLIPKPPQKTKTFMRDDVILKRKEAKGSRGRCICWDESEQRSNFMTPLSWTTVFLFDSSRSEVTFCRCQQETERKCYRHKQQAHISSFLSLQNMQLCLTAADCSPSCWTSRNAAMEVRCSWDYSVKVIRVYYQLL